MEKLMEEPLELVENPPSDIPEEEVPIIPQYPFPYIYSGIYNSLDPVTGEEENNSSAEGLFKSNTQTNLDLSNNFYEHQNCSSDVADPMECLSVSMQSENNDKCKANFSLGNHSESQANISYPMNNFSPIVSDMPDIKITPNCIENESNISCQPTNLNSRNTSPVVPNVSKSTLKRLRKKIKHEDANSAYMKNMLEMQTSIKDGVVQLVHNTDRMATALEAIAAALCQR